MVFVEQTERFGEDVIQFMLLVLAEGHFDGLGSKLEVELLICLFTEVHHLLFHLLHRLIPLTRGGHRF